MDSDMDSDTPRTTRPTTPGGRAPVKTATEARQGVTGHNVRYVVAISTIAVIVCFVIVYLVMFG